MHRYVCTYACKNACIHSCIEICMYVHTYVNYLNSAFLMVSRIKLQQKAPVTSIGASQ